MMHNFHSKTQAQIEAKMVTLYQHSVACIGANLQQVILQFETVSNIV